MCGMCRRPFLKQTKTTEARNSNIKLQPNMFLSTAFVFQPSIVPVAALGGRSFDAWALLVANAFSFAAQPNRNHIKMLRENVIIIAECCRAGQPSCIIAGFPTVCACLIHGDVQRTLEMRVGSHGKCTFVLQAHVATRWSRAAHILPVAFTCNVFGSFVAAH